MKRGSARVSARSSGRLPPKSSRRDLDHHGHHDDDGGLQQQSSSFLPVSVCHCILSLAHCLDVLASGRMPAQWVSQRSKALSRFPLDSPCKTFFVI